MVQFNNAAGGDSVTENRIVKRLPTALPSNSWTMDFDYKFTASSNPTDILVALTTTIKDPQLQPTSGDFLYVEHGNGVDQLYVHGPGGTATAGIPISPNTQYYVRVVKNPTLLTLEIFSDKARTQQIAGSPVTLAIASTDYNGNLKFIQHDACLQCGDSRTLTAQINNTLIYAP